MVTINEEKQHLLKEMEKLKEEIRMLKAGRRFGLIWEDHPEKFDDHSFPMLREIKEKQIINNGLNHYLMEGDNLHSLRSLLFSHKNNIDIIYIDPPYNTGNRDFKYNDEYVDREDVYKHSKWISFMEKRLRLARELLNNEGTLFISIDDNEMAQLKLLCDKIFGDENCLGILPTIMNLKGNQDQFGFAGTHEYTLVYSKIKEKCNITQFPIDEEEILKDWEEDAYGYFKKGANLKATGVNAPREKRPNLFFPIYVNPDNSFSVDVKREDSVEVWPITKGQEMSWRWSKNKFREESYNVIINQTKDSISISKKQRPSLGDVPTKKPKSLLYKPEYSSGNGTKELADILGNTNRIFNNPKPLELIKDIISIGSSNKNAIILDFFAGSGTTGQAVLELNRKDGGNRKFILCTNNENEIAEKVTYERIKRVIEGYVAPNGRHIAGIEGTLRYFRTHTIGNIQHPTREDIAQVLNYLEDLLRIKHVSHYMYEQEEGYSIYQNGKSIVGLLKNIYDLEVFNNKLKTLPEIEKNIYIVSHDEKTIHYITKKIKEQNKKVIIHKLPEEIQKFFSIHMKGEKI